MTAEGNEAFTQRLPNVDVKEEKEKNTQDRFSNHRMLIPKPKKKDLDILVPHQNGVDLEINVSKSSIVDQTKDVSVAGGGYFCDICDCLVKDSLSYLDHINGKKHQSFLGRTMKIKKTTLPDIRERMATLKKEREDEKSGKNGDGSETFEERVAKQKKMQNERKERQKNRKKELKKNRWD